MRVLLICTAADRAAADLALTQALGLPAPAPGDASNFERAIALNDPAGAEAGTATPTHYMGVVAAGGLSDPDLRAVVARFDGAAALALGRRALLSAGNDPTTIDDTLAAYGFFLIRPAGGLLG